MRKTYKDNPLWGRTIHLGLVNTLTRAALQMLSREQLGFVLQSATKVRFDIHNFYGSKYQEKSASLFCEFDGDILRVVKVTTPLSKHDMRERNRKMVGNVVNWKEYVSEKVS